MDMKKIKLTFSFALLAMVFVIAGCGKYKVSGKVLFEDDGSPVTRGVISFIGNNVIGSGRIKSDGSFTLGIKSETDGIPKGDYKVTIDTLDTESGPVTMGSPNSVAFTHIVDTQYASSSRSGLTATVPSKEYTFHVKRAGSR